MSCSTKIQMADMPRRPTTARPPKCGACPSSIWRKSWDSRAEAREGGTARLARLGDARLGGGRGRFLGLGRFRVLAQGCAVLDGRCGHVGQFGHGELSDGERMAPTLRVGNPSVNGGFSRAGMMLRRGKSVNCEA